MELSIESLFVRLLFTIKNYVLTSSFLDFFRDYDEAGVVPGQKKDMLLQSVKLGAGEGKDGMATQEAPTF